MTPQTIYNYRLTSLEEPFHEVPGKKVQIKRIK